MSEESPLPENEPPVRPTPLWRDRQRLHEIIFEAETPTGKMFDLILMWAIILSVVAVMLDSVESLGGTYHAWFLGVEWFFTILFTVEYVTRLYCVAKPWRYAKSFFGVVDLLAIIPTYLSLFIGGLNVLLVIRSFRLLRIFRVLKLARYLGEATILTEALKASRRKITVFLGFILAAVLIIGSVMYIIEGPENGFDSIPRGMYWAIVTMTTVGYGDISPNTWPGQTLAAIVMIMGYGIIAVPTGIVSVELAGATQKHQRTTESCPHCMKEGHAVDAVYCKYCGEHLNDFDK